MNPMILVYMIGGFFILCYFTWKMREKEILKAAKDEALFVVRNADGSTCIAQRSFDGSWNRVILGDDLEPPTILRRIATFKDRS
jgi:hypothetical protein